MILQPRDLEILRFINKFGFVSTEHLKKMFKLENTNRIYYVLRRLEQADYLKKEQVLAKQPSIYTLRTKGADLINTNKIKKISLQNINHNLLLVDIYITIKLKNPELEILSDRELRAGRGFGAKGHIPDMEIITPSQDTRKNIAIELELSRKSIKRVKSILFLLKRKYIETHYYCDNSVYSHVKKLVVGYENIKVFNYFTLEEQPQIAEVVEQIAEFKTQEQQTTTKEFGNLERDNKRLLNEIGRLEMKQQRQKEDLKRLKNTFQKIDFKKSTFGNNYSLTGEELENITLLFKGVSDD